MAVHVDLSDGVLTIVLDRLEALNAFDAASSDAVGAAMERADTDPAVRAVLFTSAHPKVFSAGADLKATAAGESAFDAAGPYASWGLAGATARTPRVPVVVGVDGLALGGGFELCLAADVLVASESAAFGLPEVAVGLMPGAGGAVRLPDQLPRKVAMDLMLTGRRLAAEEAHRLGLVSRLVPAGEAAEQAREVAAHIARQAPLGVVAAKAVALDLVDGVERAQQARWERNRNEFAAVMASDDAHEGTTAFIEKRTPHWTGR